MIETFLSSHGERQAKAKLGGLNGLLSSQQGLKALDTSSLHHAAVDQDEKVGTQLNSKFLYLGICLILNLVFQFLEYLN